ncbi:hypothetical protein PV516_19330 [Streptomyces scabiei]|uniref:hypothetical protein n=1 Tax=Streptomyces scabiei TaxID=1930 RepID=UPI0029BDE322|nr:hypothetical protein [Streptomyces scabiei]MDX3165942.1 hypothetical protein [Streptomyces scabiei]
MTAEGGQTALSVPAQPGRPGRRGIAPVTTDVLTRMLRDHFLKPGEELPGAVFLTEVTAPGQTGRRADAIHIATWASRGGGELDVCEVKTQRSDWLRELRDPGKAEAWWPHSSRYWLVVPNTDVARADELPDGWGLMVPKSRGRRFQVLVEPAKRTPQLTTGLLVTLLTNTETVRMNAMRRQRDELGDRHRAELRRLREEGGAVRNPQLEERLDLLKRLEQALGGRLGSSGWGAFVATDEAAEALAAYAQPHIEQQRGRQRAARLAETLGHHRDQLTRLVSELEKATALPEQEQDPSA